MKEENQHTEAPPVDLDREMPSVNSRKKKGNKLVNYGVFAVIGLFGAMLIYQMNAGPSRKEKQAVKAEKQAAERNEVKNSLPDLKLPPPDQMQAGSVGFGAQPASAAAAAPVEPEMPLAPGLAGHGAPSALLGNGQQPAADQSGQPTPFASANQPAGVYRLDQRRGPGGAAGAPDTAETLKQRKMGASLMPEYFDAQNSGSKDNVADQVQAAMAAARGTGSVPIGGMMQTSSAGGTNELDRLMQPSVTPAVQAQILPNRNFLLTKGTYLDCALETAIDSTVPGITSCRLTRDIYSENGKVVLLDKGTKIVGEFRGGLKQGDGRIFVLWTRATTPTGVSVNLDSPGADSLGRAGHEGYVDTKFWDRFGAAIMFSLIDDLMPYAAEKASNGEIVLKSTTESAGDTAKTIVQSTINIPPRLVKNQGEHIIVVLGRDIDFRSVYRVRPRTE